MTAEAESPKNGESQPKIELGDAQREQLHAFLNPHIQRAEDSLNRHREELEKLPQNPVRRIFARIASGGVIPTGRDVASEEEGFKRLEQIVRDIDEGRPQSMAPILLDDLVRNYGEDPNFNYWPEQYPKTDEGRQQVMGDLKSLLGAVGAHIPSDDELALRSNHQRGLDLIGPIGNTRSSSWFPRQIENLRTKERNATTTPLSKPTKV